MILNNRLSIFFIWHVVSIALKDWKDLVLYAETGDVIDNLRSVESLAFIEQVQYW